MAANEMKERFLKLMGEDSTRVVFGTFHAVFFTILKHAYNLNAGSIVRPEQQRACIQRAIHKYNVDVEDENDFITSVLGEIGKVKSEMIDPKVYYSINCPENTFRYIYEDYDRELKKNRLIDFDDMLVYCYEPLDKRRDILAAWQNKYEYILVDEFQDINKVQYDVVKLLALKNRNIFVVGDDDQSIYGFRGAKPEIMQRFTKDYKDTALIKLDINYRSTANIVNVAKSVIDQNNNRFKKDIRTTNALGDLVQVRGFEDSMDENTCIVDGIRKYVEGDCNYRDIAVLTRTNIGARQAHGKIYRI